MTDPNIDPCLSGIKQEEQYEKFQQWLNDCPVNITNYQDFTDEFEITFKLDQWRKLTMRWKVELYIGGTVFEEIVVARNQNDAKDTALARNPTARVISCTAVF